MTLSRIKPMLLFPNLGTTDEGSEKPHGREERTSGAEARIHCDYLTGR